MAKQSSKVSPFKTKTGKTRLGPLNLTQLKDMFEKASSSKLKDKISTRISKLEKRNKKH